MQKLSQKIKLIQKSLNCMFTLLLSGPCSITPTYHDPSHPYCLKTAQGTCLLKNQNLFSSQIRQMCKKKEKTFPNFPFSPVCPIAHTGQSYTHSWMASAGSRSLQRGSLHSLRSISPSSILRLGFSPLRRASSTQLVWLEGSVQPGFTLPA